MHKDAGASGRGIARRLTDAGHRGTIGRMTSPRFASFQEFYPYYLGEHSQPLTRALHYAGTTLVVVIAIAAVVTQRWWLLAALPVAGYGFAWVAHFLVEKNRPATFTHPLWSLRGDFRMWWDWVTRRGAHD